MKTRMKILVLSLLVAILALAGCFMMDGLSAQQRVNEFLNDIVNNNPIGEHFSGHVNSAVVAGEFFDGTSLEPDIIPLIFSASVNDNDFTIYKGGTVVATGEVINLSSTGGNDWYIYQITVDGNTVP